MIELFLWVYAASAVYVFSEILVFRNIAHNKRPDMQDLREALGFGLIPVLNTVSFVVLLVAMVNRLTVRILRSL